MYDVYSIRGQSGSYILRIPRVPTGHVRRDDDYCMRHCETQHLLVLLKFVTNSHVYAFVAIYKKSTHIHVLSTGVLDVVPSIGTVVRLRHVPVV